MDRRKYTEFRQLRAKYFITRQQAAELFQVTPRTIRRWDTIKAANWATRELQRKDRNLAGYHPKWAGFKIGWNGRLYGPHGLQITPEQLTHWQSLITQQQAL